MMAFDFTSARVNPDGELCLAVKNVPMARKFVIEMRNRVYTAEIKEYRKKRSLDANAYFWVLCDKLAEATNVPKEEIYRNAIRDIGGVSDTVCVTEKAAPKLKKIWSGRGIGWFCETMPSKIPGCVNITLYSGSSTFDTKQMSRLIDNIVQDCKAVGVETMTPAELCMIKEAWE